jgi:hypothetical protein
VGVTAAVIVLAPRIAETNRERADRERREQAVERADERRRLIAEQRPHRGRSEPSASRAETLRELRRAILTDVRARVASGNLDGPPAKRVSCERLAGGPGGERGRVAYDCIAITSELPAIEGKSEGVLGHPFRAVVDYSTGRFTWCKYSGRPGEGSLTERGLEITLPRACSL